jgi:hypothetical protein
MDWESKNMGEQQIIPTLGLYAAAQESHSRHLFSAVFAADLVSDYPGGLHWSDLASFKADFTATPERQQEA